MWRLQQYKNAWRGAILALLLVALVGPWWFDLIYVPAEYDCTTAVRLDGNFCGIPMAGVWLLTWIVAMPAGEVAGLVAGTTALADFWIRFLRSLGISLLLLIYILPFFSTLFMIVRGEGPRRRIFHIIAWGLAAGAGVLFGLSSHPELFWVLWGVWLYVGLAVSALVLEVLADSNRLPGKGS